MSLFYLSSRANEQGSNKEKLKNTQLNFYHRSSFDSHFLGKAYIRDLRFLYEISFIVLLYCAATRGLRFDKKTIILITVR